MRLTKYNHACFTVEDEGQLLVVDPGNFSDDFIAPARVSAVVITHQHADHFDHDQLAAIIDKNPDAIIVAHPEVIAQIDVFQTLQARAGETLAVGPFRLSFYGGAHATIHDSLPAVANLGVMINDLLYYPGDSFTVPEAAVDTLALPVAAPWLKIGEVMDFLAAVHPRLAFPTHDAILSADGKSMVDRLLIQHAGTIDILYRRSDTLDI